MMIYTPVGSGRNNFFLRSDFVAADVSPLILSGGKLEPIHVGCYIRQNPSNIGLFARTDGKIAAQMGKSPHGGKVGPHGTGDCPHGLKNRRTKRKTGARMGESPHGNGNCPHRSANRPHEPIFLPTNQLEPRYLGCYENGSGASRAGQINVHSIFDFPEVDAGVRSK